MLLSALAERVPGPAELIGEDVDVIDVTHDSRQVEAGSLFVAVRGFETDGHGHVGEAIGNGAIAVAVEEAADVAVGQLVVARGQRLRWQERSVQA